MKPHLYVNSKGFMVTRHSYSGGDSFGYCARKYYLERVQGWSEKTESAAKYFGTALEKAITFWHQHREDTPGAVNEFVRLWEKHKDKPYKYNKTDLDWNRLNLTGQELTKLYAIKYRSFPYIVNNPDDFQVETNFEIFPDTKLAGIEFTSYIDLVAKMKGSGNPIIIDMKTAGKDVPELTVLDPQLRSYSWVKGWPDVAFLWFRKMGRTISRGDSATFLDPYRDFVPGQDVVVLLKDDFGIWVIPKNDSEKIFEDMDKNFVGKSKAVESARQSFIEANSKHVPENVVTKQRVQFKSAVIPIESAEDIGSKIKDDVINILRANELDRWPMNSGVRFPNEKCPNCSMRGICSNNPDLRDMIVTRKQLDEIDFGHDEE